MGVLKASGARTDSNSCDLSARTLIGRAPRCELRLDNSTISAEHATIFWNGRHWCVKDLGSRNGTWVDGEKLQVGQSLPLLEGSRVAFGAAEATWTLEDTEPPPASAMRADGQRIVAKHGLLLLPTVDAPQAMIFASRDGAGWMLEQDDQVRRVEDRCVVQLSEGTYVLDLPDVLPSTEKTSQVGVHSCRFRVSRDEEHVELTLEWDGGSTMLWGRVHLYVLLLLARARVHDNARDELIDEERGWVFREDLERMTRLDRLTINTHVSRARAHLAADGVPNAGHLVERRPGQLRFGVATIEELPL